MYISDDTEDHQTFSFVQASVLLQVIFLQLQMTSLCFPPREKVTHCVNYSMSSETNCHHVPIISYIVIETN
jgi:hypothetical protein